MAFALAAVAMMATTLDLTVVLPAEMEPTSHEARTLAKQAAVTPAASTGAVVKSLRVDVDANREPRVNSVQVRSGHSKRKQQG